MVGNVRTISALNQANMPPMQSQITKETLTFLSSPPDGLVAYSGLIENDQYQ